MRIIAMILFEFKQGLKEKTFWAVVFFFIFLIAVSIFLGELSLGNKGDVLRVVCLSSIELSAFGLVLIRSTYNFYRERESRLAEIYLSYFSPAHYMMQKLAGTIIILFTYIFLSTLLGAVLLALNDAFKLAVFIGAYSIFLKLCFVCAFVYLISSIINYPFLSSLLTTFIYIASELSYNAWRVALRSKTAFIKLPSEIFYYILPNYHGVDLKTQAIYGGAVSAFYITEITIYTFFYCLLCYLVATAIFERKDI